MDRKLTLVIMIMLSLLSLVTVIQDGGSTHFLTSDLKQEGPEAEISASDTEVNNHEMVSFDASNSTPSSGSNISTYQWDFQGDGHYDDSGISVSYSYYEPGTYEVELLITDSSGLTDKDTITVEVVNLEPEADFIYSPIDPKAGNHIEFSDLSKDPDGYIETRIWTFDDGERTTEKDPTHAFEDDGIHNVTLKVVDDEGDTDSITKEIEVKNKPPYVYEINIGYRYNHNDNKVEKGESVKFLPNADDINGEIVSWEWKFGDGTSSTKEKPEHIYDEEGEYVVNLTVTDDDGASSSIERTIIVEKSSSKDSGFFNAYNMIYVIPFTLVVIIALIAIIAVWKSGGDEKHPPQNIRFEEQEEGEE